MFFYESSHLFSLSHNSSIGENISPHNRIFLLQTLHEAVDLCALHDAFLRSNLIVWEEKLPVLWSLLASRFSRKPASEDFLFTPSYSEGKQSIWTGFHGEFMILTEHWRLSVSLKNNFFFESSHLFCSSHFQQQRIVF